MKKRGLRSPDLADAFLLTFACGERRKVALSPRSRYGDARLGPRRLKRRLPDAVAAEVVEEAIVASIGTDDADAADDCSPSQQAVPVEVVG